jgi:hypothetical protein
MRAGRKHDCADIVRDVEGAQSGVACPPARAYLTTALGARSDVGVRPNSFHCRRFDSQAMESLHFHKAALAAERRARTEYVRGFYFRSCYESIMPGRQIIAENVASVVIISTTSSALLPKSCSTDNVASQYGIV